MELLKVENLSVEIGVGRASVKAVRDVSFSLQDGEILAVCGESGCGKSMLCKSIMGLLPKSGKITKGSIYIEGMILQIIQNARWNVCVADFFQ